MSSVNLKTAFYDAMFGTTGRGMNTLEKKALENVRGILNSPAKLSSHIRPLPVLLIQLLELLKDPDTDYRELSKLIQQDPSLATRVLRVVNSPLYRGRVEILDLESAIGRIGIAGISSIASAIMMEKVRPQKPIYYKMFGRLIWVHSLHCAHLCRDYAAISDADQFSGYFLGLIHDVGKIIVFDCLNEALSSGILDGDPGSAVFKETMSEMSMDISTFVAREWALPEEFAVALEQQRMGPETPLAKALLRANACAEIYLLLERGRLKEDDVDDLLEEADYDVDVWRKFQRAAPEIATMVQ